MADQQKSWRESIGNAEVEKNASEQLLTSPLDEYNAHLLDQVHPRTWVNPEPVEIYDMVAIGAGAGGLVTAAASSRKNVKAALIEENLMGGDCLNIGCVPSKALLACAKRVHQIRSCDAFGVSLPQGEVKVDFGAIMQRMRKIRAEIAENDSQPRFTGLGVDVFLGRGRFTSPTTIEVNGKTLNFKKACIATGGHAAIPDVPGLRNVGALTNATLFNLTELPRRFVVIGAGPVGCEMAQAFARFGSTVTLMMRSDGILKGEDPEAASIVQHAMEADGVCMITNARYTSVARTETKEIIIQFVDTKSGQEHSLVCDQLLVAAGREAGVHDLGLDTVNVAYSNRGVEVNDLLQTSNPNVYSVGDACLPGKHRLTHMAGETANMVVNNALGGEENKLSALIVPACTYTDPEIAHTGASEAELKQNGTPYVVTHREFRITDRNICDGDDAGFVKLFCVPEVGRILGGVVVGSMAGELISTVTLCIKSEVKASALASVIVPYPTKFENVKYAGNRFSFTLNKTPEAKTPE